VARSFDVRTANTAGVQEVREAFADRSYWLERLEVYGGESMTLEALTVTSDGTIEVRSVQDMRRGALPAVIARALPADFVLHRVEIWRPVPDGRLRGDVRIDARGVRGRARGTADVTPEATGSSMTFSGTVEVGVPVLGGQIEKYIAAEIVEQIPGVGRFTDEWIANR
jgi:hypothetical protein